MVAGSRSSGAPPGHPIKNLHPITLGLLIGQSPGVEFIALAGRNVKDHSNTRNYHVGTLNL